MAMRSSSDFPSLLAASAIVVSSSLGWSSFTPPFYVLRRSRIGCPEERLRERNHSDVAIRAAGRSWPPSDSRIETDAVAIMAPCWTNRT